MQRDLVTIMQNEPLPVNFAGLRGTTMDMQNDGWQLAVSMNRMHLRDSYRFHLTGKHSGLQLYFYSGMSEIDARMIHMGMMEGFISYARSMQYPIRISHVADNITMATMGQQTAMRFSAVDFSDPYMTHVERSNISLDQLVPFKSFNEDSEILIPENKIWTVQEHLDAILTEHKPYQKELREKKRKKHKRELGAEPTVNMHDAEKSDVKLQLVAV